ncbi:tetratricopeptide repeat protein, partial [Moorena sp. SIO3F7]|uniref:tetratricopeptide repeat protein n=1 Tax=Moorena sp. SIO3F7 TaxID=2607839 RepID=UPI0025E0BB57
LSLPVALPIPDSRFPIPDSRFAIPSYRFPIPDSRFPIPDSRFPIPDSRFPIPLIIMKKLSFVIAIALTCFLPSGKALSNSKIITADSRLPIPDSRFPIPDSRLPTPNSRFPIPDSRFPISDSPEQQAQHLYETGQYQEAIPLLEQIISNYSDSGDIIGEINSLVNLALVYQTLGDIDQAKQTLSQSFTQL